MKRPVDVLLVFLAAATIVLAVPFAAGAAPQITGVFNFLENRGPNTVGFSVGQKFQIGAYVQPDPDDPVVSVEANPVVMGNPSYTLQPYPYPVRPGLWTNSPPPDYAGQFGQWVFTATSSGNQVGSLTSYFLSDDIPALPLAQNIVVTPNGTTPTISWDAVPGAITTYQVTLMTAPTNMFHQVDVPLSANPQWTVPGGVLSPGQMYTARIRAVYSTIGAPAGTWQSVSSAYVNFTTSSPVFNADFNTDPQGYEPISSPPGLPSGDSITSTCAPTGVSTTIPCSVNEFWVNTVTSFSTTPHLVVNKISDNSPRIRFHPDPAEATGTVFTISWRSASMQSSNYILFDLYTSGRGGPAARVSYGTLGYIYYYDYNAVQMVLPAPPVTYSPYNSQLFSMVVDLSAGMYDLFVDKVKVATGAGLDPANNSGSFETGSLVLWENTLNSTVLVDDIRMIRGADLDGDGIPDDAVVDTDGDGIADGDDNCLTEFNPGQADGDYDGVGDLCDNCPSTYNPPDIEFGQPDVCSGNYASPPPVSLSPVLVQACFQFTDPNKEYVVKPTCANTVWELKKDLGGGETSVLEASGCVNGPPVGIPDDLVPVKDINGNPISYCTEPCNLLERFLPDMLTAPPGETITYLAGARFTTLVQCPPGEIIPGYGSPDVCPGILMVSVASDPVPVEILPETNRLIDIYPGTYPNLINPGATGTTPVAIIGSPAFDVTKVDLATVTMAGAYVATYTDKKTKKKVYITSTKDFNGDGYLDLIVHFVTSQLGLSPGDSTITLTGTNDGVSFTGEDSIQVVRGSRK